MEERYLITPLKRFIAVLFLLIGFLVLVGSYIGIVEAGQNKNSAIASREAPSLQPQEGPEEEAPTVYWVLRGRGDECQNQWRIHKRRPKE